MISGYISGGFQNFEQRLHQFCTGVDSLELFKLEAYNGGYTGLSYISKNTKNHWAEEYMKKSYLYNFPTGNVFP